MYQYYLFDLDGTLTDPKIGITSSAQYALRDFGIEEENLDKLEPFIGPPLIDSFMEFYGMTRSEAEKAVVKYRERFSVKGKYEKEKSDPERTVMIGDRKFDIEGAKAHGLHSVGCAYGYAAEGELEKAGAEVIVNSVEALKEVLLR